MRTNVELRASSRLREVRKSAHVKVEKTDNRSSLIPPLYRSASDGAVQSVAGMQTAIGVGYQQWPQYWTKVDMYLTVDRQMVCVRPSLGCQKGSAASDAKSKGISRRSHVSFSSMVTYCLIES